MKQTKKRGSSPDKPLLPVFGHAVSRLSCEESVRRVSPRRVHEPMNGSCFALAPLDGPSLSVTLSCDVLASPFPCAATTAALADFPGRLSYGTSAGGACKPCQDGLRLRLERRSGLASGYAARHARQTGLLQDAKPQQGVPTGAPSRPAHPTALLHARGASQGGIDSSSDHSSRYTPVSEGTKAWVVDSFIEGQPMSSRRSGMKRRAALMFDLTGDPPPKRDPSSSSSGTSFKPTARRPFAYLPDHRLDFDEEDDE